MTKALNNPLVGWGLLTAWGLVGMQLDIPSKMGQLPFQNVLAAGVSSMCLVIFIMTRFFIIHRKRNTYFLEPGMQISRTLYTGSTMMVASCLLNQLNLATQSIVWIHYLTQIVSSIGYVILILIWCHIYGDMDSQKIEDHTILSTAVCAFVYLIAIMSPLLVKTILWVVLPAASTWLLTRCLATNADTQPNNLVEKPLSNSCEKQGITPAHVLCGIGVFVGTAASLLPGSLLLFDHSLPQLPYIEYAQLSGVALAVCLVFILYDICTTHQPPVILQSAVPSGS